MNDLTGKRPDIRFVTMDTLAKVLCVGDLNDYMATMTAAEQLHKLAREFTKLHIQVLAHNKKAETSDPFDAILGSTALRGEPDTNMVIFTEDGHRIIQTETRIGRNIPASLLKADIVNSAGADVVEKFYLDSTLEQYQENADEKKQATKSASMEQRIIDYLSAKAELCAAQEDVLSETVGKRQTKLEIIGELKANGVLSVSGKPLILYLKPKGLEIYKSLSKFAGRGN
jgi:hypothetical protein